MRRGKMFYISLLIINFFVIAVFERCSPVRSFMQWKNYAGENNFAYSQPAYDKEKKTIVIIADNMGTEIFDMLAPFYLFNATGKANVYIVAEKKYPIIVRKGLFILPQFSFTGFDSLNIKPDVIIMPNLSAMDAKHQNPVIIDWIKKHYSHSIKMLSVCDGSLTAAATGLYDGKPITTHASDLSSIKKQYIKPAWVSDTSVTNSDNLYSTAGVSNAVQGSLVVIKDLFGNEVMLDVLQKINYPYQLPKLQHESRAISFSDKINIGNKVFFKSNKRIGVLLQEGINEFELAAILDVYNRTFPKSIDSYSLHDAAVTSAYGLTILPTAQLSDNKLDEIHILNYNEADSRLFLQQNIVKYDTLNKKYIINDCLDRVKLQYSDKFHGVVMRLLDYN